MNIKKMKLPTIILAMGLILAIVACFFTCIKKEPVIKEHEFDYAVTYRLDGEVKTYEGSFQCSFAGFDEHDDPTVRLYNGVHTKNQDSFWFTIAQKNDVVLSVVIDLDAAYLMGDPDKYEYVSGNEEPYLEAVDQEGYGVEVSDLFDAEIISWEYPQPVENSFEFAGFSRLYAASMLVMLLIGALTIIACVIFVKKNADISYRPLDKVSIAVNFLISFMTIPFITIAIFLFPLVMDSDSLMYQIYLCIPALTAFTVAASVALRRKGFTKSGFFVQFVFPVLFFAEIIAESVINNVFC